MKKITFVIFLGLFVFYFFLFNAKKNSCQNQNAVIYQLENKKYCLLVAASVYEHQKGLMYVRKPVNFDGMIFIFPDKQIRSFWNMNTYLDLDLYWLDDDRIVSKDYLPSIEKSKKVVSIQSKKPINKVIEMIR